MKECRATEKPPWISKQRFVRSNRCIEPAKVVEKSEVVIDLKDQRWGGHCQSGEVDPSNPSRVSG